MVDEGLAYTPASDLLELIAAKQVSPVELVEMFLERIDRLDPQLNSFLLVTRELAMEQARAAEAAVMRGDELGPLHGLPVSIKDTQMTAGVPSTMGSVVFEDRVPERNAAVVERVLQAGAVMLGKTNVPEFGMVGTCENSLGVLGRNPWNTDRTPGGSSGGAAAAVAAGLCPMSTGSDGGGSLRIPANFCGIYTIKPTQGRVSGYTGLGGPPLPNIFSQAGPLTRTVRDSAILLQAMAGFDRRDHASIRRTPPDFVAATGRPIDGLRIGWTSDFGFAPVWPEVVDVTSRAARVFEELGCSVEEVKMVLPEPYDSFGPIQAAGVYNNLVQYLDEYGDRMTEFARFFIEKGSRVTTEDYMRSEGRIAELKATFDDAFETCDLIMSPVSCFPAFPNETFPGSITGDSSYPVQYWNGAFTMHGNAIGHPAASVPAGFSADGLPIGLQIIGRKYDEETVLAASAAFEEARSWVQHRPAAATAPTTSPDTPQSPGPAAPAPPPAPAGKRSAP